MSAEMVELIADSLTSTKAIPFGILGIVAQHFPELQADIKALKG